jgi:hypothetical protein
MIHSSNAAHVRNFYILSLFPNFPCVEFCVGVRLVCISVCCYPMSAVYSPNVRSIPNLIRYCFGDSSPYG